MATLFIADLHLSQQEPAITAGFLHFLQRQAVHADALYILGDLFELWIGDDDPSSLHAEIAAALRQLTRKGVPCFFIHGNRDFLIGKRFAGASGMTLLPQEQLLTLYDRPILVLHGDTLCTDDRAYQRYRRRVNQRWLQRLFLLLPLKRRLRIAERMRTGSQRANRAKSAVIMDVNPQAVIAALQRHGVKWMIHGHTHRPAIHTIALPDGKAHRAVLGAWHQQGSMIKVTPDSIELVEFPF
ncbi:UDP-2,3-diacylglucosamine diphosphatase [Sodalis sp. RH21]|uniref:UDP-2,3-diacylglucosamine diphosphatase n=1 Tax=unclassified Sodalis (in: enterobacteria) TaxID=2636512 RepID=UPI0039B45C95